MAGELDVKAIRNLAERGVGPLPRETLALLDALAASQARVKKLERRIFEMTAAGPASRGGP